MGIYVCTHWKGYNIDTKPSSDTDEIIEMYINTLDRIYKEDDEYREIIINSRKGVINDRTSK